MQVRRGGRRPGGIGDVGLGSGNQDAFDRPIARIADCRRPGARRVEPARTVLVGQADHALGGSQMVQRPAGQQPVDDLGDVRAELGRLLTAAPTGPTSGPAGANRDPPPPGGLRRSRMPPPPRPFTGRGLPPIYCSDRCRSRAVRRPDRGPVLVELVHPATAPRQRASGRVWTIRLRRGSDTITIAGDLGHASARDLADQIAQILRTSTQQGGPID